MGAQLMGLNRGAYAPRASLIAPGVNPATGAVNSVAPGVSTQPTAPQTFTGGQSALENAIAVKKAQQEATGQTFENTLRQAQAQNQQSQAAGQTVRSMADIIKANAYRQNLQNKPVQLTPQQKQAQLDAEKNADTVPRIVTDLKNMTTPEEAKQWIAGVMNGTLKRGSISNGIWTPDPNGPLVSPSQNLAKPPGNKSDGFLGIGASPGSYSEDDASPNQPIDAIQPFMDRYQKVKAAGGRYVPQGQGGGPPAGNPNAGSVPGDVNSTVDGILNNPAAQKPGYVTPDPSRGGAGNFPTLSSAQGRQLPPNQQFRGADGQLYWSPGSTPQ